MTRIRGADVHKPAEQTGIEIGRAIDALPISPFQYWIAFLICLTLFLEGFDGQVMPLAVADMAKHWGLAPAKFAPALSAALVGSMLSAVLIAPLGDRYGRRPLLVGSVLLTGIGTIVTAYASVMTIVIVGRVCTGIGLGVSFPIAISIISDFFPARRRALFVTIAVNSLVVGAVSSGWAAPTLVETWGWKGLFYAGGALPIACGTLLLFALPESPKFLLLSGRKPARTRKLLERLGIKSDVEVYYRPELKKKGGSVTALFQGGMGGATLTLWFLFFTILLTTTTLQYWLPTLLTLSGLPRADSFRISSFEHLGSLFGGLLLLYPANRGWLLPTLGVAFAVAVATLMALGLTSPEFILWSVLVFGVGLGVGGSFLALNAVTASVYPSEIQVTGMGWAMFVGRIGAILSAFAGAVLIDLFLPSTIFSLLAVPPLLCCVGLIALVRLQRKRVHAI